MIDVTLLGTGGMLPLPSRALTSLYVRHEGRAILIDCGEGMQTAIRTCGLRFKPIEAILITHFHADHMSGLPGLLLTLGNETRAEPLHMIGPAGLKGIVKSLLCIAPEIPYQIIFHEYGEESTPISFAGLEIDAFALDHGVPCLGYRLTLKRPGKFDLQKAQARSVPRRLWKRLQNGEAVGSFSPCDVLGAPRKGISLLYATDTRPVDALLEYGKGTDLMILEGMFGEESKQARAEQTHHMMMREAALLAREANTKALWLTHYSPATPEPEQYADMLREIFPGTVVCADGQTTTLVFDKK